jgi:hypothetical protein
MPNRLSPDLIHTRHHNLILIPSAHHEITVGSCGRLDNQALAGDSPAKRMTSQSKRPGTGRYSSADSMTGRC